MSKTKEPKSKYPPLEDLRQLCVAVKKGIDDDFRVSEDPDDNIPGICLTVGADNSGWSYQTGDNSYSGGAYHYANWAVVGIYRDSNCKELAREIRDQLEELY